MRILMNLGILNLFRLYSKLMGYAQLSKFPQRFTSLSAVVGCFFTEGVVSLLIGLNCGSFLGVSFLKKIIASAATMINAGITACHLMFCMTFFVSFIEKIF